MGGCRRTAVCHWDAGQIPIRVNERGVEGYVCNLWCWGSPGVPKLVDGALFV
jgi:hypothetical protein